VRALIREDVGQGGGQAHLAGKPTSRQRPVQERRGGLRELALVALLYVAYTGSRLLAAGDRAPALYRAHRLLALEATLGADFEHAMVNFFAAHQMVGLLSCYWYSAAHYLVTPVALFWLYRQGRRAYIHPRRALLIATALGLAMYLLVPTAPPRMVAGYPDILSLHASAGWWGSDASAPRGLGGLTNELAAFPSLHAGWSLWVALTTQRWARRPMVRLAGWLHAALTALVVVGTANHWVLDVVGGWLMVILGWALATAVWESPDARDFEHPTALRSKPRARAPNLQRFTPPPRTLPLAGRRDVHDGADAAPCVGRW
jgi:hypothetical protein